MSALRYVWRDLVRNPRRTLSSLVGVVLGVGLFAGVLFFVDGSTATMTKRALAPLNLDMQRVLTSPFGVALALDEAAESAGTDFKITLHARNNGTAPANEVVINDEPSLPLSYVPATTTLDGKPLPDVAGQSPLAQGLARSGYNVGTVDAGKAVTVTYHARSSHSVDLRSLALRGTISSRENVVPIRANSQAPTSIDQVRAEIARVRGVRAADALRFVDLPIGSLGGGGRTVQSPVRVFAFDEQYPRHYPLVRITKGVQWNSEALVSIEASGSLQIGTGETIDLKLPQGKALTLHVSGLTDLSRAKPLFNSRKTTKFEDFLYIPNTIVVPPSIFTNAIEPAFRSARATVGSTIKTSPVLEIDVLLERAPLSRDPGRALTQAKAIAQKVNAIAPGQDYLIDNISNALEVARDDAAVGKRMFVFLGLPGALLAALFASFAGSILAAAQRRDLANLRLRGADGAYLLRMLASRTLIFAGLGSIVGTGLGLAAATVVLGPDVLRQAATSDILTSASIAIGVGMLTTAVALFVPGHRSLRREINEGRAEIAPDAAPAWQRFRLDFALLILATTAGGIALATGRFDTPRGSVSAGRAVLLPTHLLAAPICLWIGGTLLAVRVITAVVARLPIPGHEFGPVVRGIFVRSLKKRSSAFGSGTLAVTSVIAFAVGLATFSATYDHAKASDARFTVGSDLRVTPGAESNGSDMSARLAMPGVAAVTPVTSKLENAVLVGPYDQNRVDLAAIDPRSFERVAALSDSFFVGRTASATLDGLARRPDGLLMNATTAGGFSVKVGDHVRVLLARGTKQQKTEEFRVAGLFTEFPGFPEGVDLVVDRGRYTASTRDIRPDFYLVGTTGPLKSAVRALRAGPGNQTPINIDTRTGALSKDQSSLTALNVRGLVGLDSLFTLAMIATALAIFVFGLMLERRKEYVTLRALGMRARELRTLVGTEAVLVAVVGTAAGALVGSGLATMLVQILRPLFTLRPGVTFPIGEVVRIAALAMTSALISALGATALLRRLKPTEVLRES